MMDKKSLLAIALITVVILLLPSYYDLVYDKQELPPEPPPEMLENSSQDIGRSAKDDLDQTKSMEKTAKSNILQEPTIKGKTIEESEHELYNEDIEQVFTWIETPLVSLKLSNQGGGNIDYWYLREYNTWMNSPAKIIDETLKNGIFFTFLTADGDKIDLNKYRFEIVGSQPTKIELKAEESHTISYQVKIKESVIRKSLTFYANTYHVKLSFEISDAKGLLLNDDYEIGWQNGLPSNERNTVEDYTYSETYAQMGGELEDFDIDSEELVRPQPINGSTEWIATRTKYFLISVIPDKAKTTAVVFGGEGVMVEDVLTRRYKTSLVSAVIDENLEDSYKIYMGPLEYSVLSDYDNGLDRLIMNHGWYETTFRPISLLILRVFDFFKLFIPNYGIIIIVFSVLVKIVVYPLTKKSYQSMKEMSRVQPLLAEIREKYKSDPQRMNKETMKLYKEHGINPMGGCLPMLLQLPLLGALFIVFRSTIQLRGASFIPGWIDDLSSADTIFTLPFSLPMYGDQFNILPILMAVTMIFQSKMTMQDPKQKAMVYIMPIFMLLIFNQFPSGLNLYYTMFNVLTIIQQQITDGNGKKKENK
jgi:YidC/Oxa1 family membrane protein insertase